MPADADALFYTSRRNREKTSARVTRAG
jgi:hypothetical protein